MQVHSSMNSVLPALNKPQSSARCETPARNILRLSLQNLSRTVDCALRLSKNKARSVAPQIGEGKVYEFKSQRHQASVIRLHRSFFDVQLM
jgi:hypothetical protein